MTKPSIAVFLLLLLQLTPVAQTGGASIEGAVIRAGTGEALAGARVTLTPVTASGGASGNPVVSGISSGLPLESAIVAVSSSAASSNPSVTTDADGRFSFQNVDPGIYSLQVLRNGYARQSFGQRIAGGPATAIRIAAGQSIKNVVMTLLPAGNVSGVIRGSDGQPQSGVPIQLLRASFNANGQRTFQVEGTARTNDRGEYRLYWLTPGRYFVSAGSPPGPNRTSGPSISPNEIPERSFTLSFYPGVLDPRAAGLIDVAPGAEIYGIDFSVPSQELHRIRGRIVDSSLGQPPPAVGLSVAYRTLTGNSAAFSAGEKYDPKTGEFELRNVPPGSYVLQAIALDHAPPGERETVVRIGAVASRPNARIQIGVGNADLEGVLLTLTSGASLPGRITVDGMTLSSLNGWERIRLQLKPTLDSAFGPNLQPAAPLAHAPRADGSFVISGVSPGEFAVGPVTGLPPGFYVKEARYSQVDVLSQPIRFSGVASGALEVIISSKASQLDGVVLDGRSSPFPGARLVLVPDRQRNRTDLYKTTLSDANGRFLFRSIPPGDYRVFAWEALESYAYFDQDLLQRVESQSAPVRVSEAAANSTTVRIIPLNQ